jgi:uncharacterized protein YjeT (DUF2065 family)
MSGPLSFLLVSIGVLIIVTRAPLIFAPSATLRFAAKLVSTDLRVRGWGLVLVPMSAALIVLPIGSGAAHESIRGFGWICAAATLWLLIAPATYRRSSIGVLDFLESSVDLAVLRIIGLVAVVIGILVIYLGLHVV